MKNKRPIVVVLAATMLAAPTVIAGGPDRTNALLATDTIPAQVVALGGAPLTGANGLSLDGTVGEVDSAAMTGASGLSLASGFWPVVVQLTGDKIFASGFEASP